MNRFLLLLVCLAIPLTSSAQKPRARQLGLPMEGRTGPLNAITDLKGVEVGFKTLIEGEAGPVVVGQGPVRTGVTAVLPRGHAGIADPVFAAWFTLNGNGEMTGTTWVEESGFAWGPLMITNTHSVGVVRDAVIAWAVDQGMLDFDFALPIVAETYDSLNDINGQHVTREHTFEALDAAAPGPVAEGNVGGGTGMICHGFKGGTGTASQVTTIAETEYTVGVLVQCNYGSRSQLRILGVPVGLEMPNPPACWASPEPNTRRNLKPCDVQPPGDGEDRGSIIIIVGTDAPLLPHQLKRIVKRAALGVGKMGGIGGNSSGDIFIAFSTANPGASNPEGTQTLEMLPNDAMNPLMQATVWATEEAIVNALLAAETMTGANYLRIPALPHDRLLEVMRKYGRIE